MSIIDDKIDALIMFQLSINDTITEELSENKHIIIDMNTQNQLYDRGVDSREVKISDFSPYTARTISIKQAKGQVVDRVTLRDTGDFHNSFEVIFFEEGFVIVAEDVKTNDLIKKYGEDIIGLTDINKDELTWDYIYTALINKRDSLL